MEEAPENGKESSNSAHTNGMNEWIHNIEKHKSTILWHQIYVIDSLFKYNLTAVCILSGAFIQTPIWITYIEADVCINAADSDLVLQEARLD